MLEVGAIVGGRLRVDQIIGAGGMGIVVAATHLELGNRVAIKFLRDELAQNAVIVERFIREARAVVNLKTEHVCRVLDVGRLDSGAPYIVMEMLAGSDLARAISQRPLPVATAVDYVLQACVALAEAHAAGIVHRDLKPANLFVTRRLDGGPLVKVLDFGIAKAMDAAGPSLTQTAGMMGSPGYMSPEQLLSARDVDTRTDIWALGVTLYQLVSARMPFPAPTLTEISIKVATDPPAPLDVDPDLAAVIFRCLEKQPERRYPSVAALAADLVKFGSSDGRRTAALAAALPGHAAAPTLAPAPVASDAPTAASVASSPFTPHPAAQTPAPEPTIPARRARWPLVLGALVLVGGTVGIMLAVTRNQEAAPVSPEPAPVVTQTVDAGVFTVVARDGGDAWATTAEPSLVDAGRKDEDDDFEEVVVGPEDVGIVMTGTMKEQMKTGCRAMVAQVDRLPKVDTLRMQLIQCWCALDNIDKAQAVLAQMTDKKLRQGARAACAMQGGKLK